MSGLRRLVYFVLGFVLAIAAGAVYGQSPQSYVPLQPPHWGNWYSPLAVGEGIELSVIDDGSPSGLLIFAQVFVLTPTGPQWASAQGRAPAAWAGNDYRFDLFQRPAPNTAPVIVGFMRLRPTLFGYMEWAMVLDADLTSRSALLLQVTAPVPGIVGRCGPSFQAPPPPFANPRYCHN